MSNCQNPVCLSILNNSTQKPTVFIDKEETLEVELLNNTGGDITLNSGNDNPAKLSIGLPDFYSNVDYINMAISLKDWKLLPYQSGDLLLILQYSADTDGKWENGKSISFQITKAKSSQQTAATGQAQVNFSGMNGNNIPLSVFTNLDLSKAPSPGNENLPLDVTLNSNKVFVSNKENPVNNNLLLNFKNTGKTSLYTGKNSRPGNARVTVSFIYGNTSGALAPDADKDNPQIGSAWNINGKVSISQGNDWYVKNPVNTGQENSPSWIMEPTSTNNGIIGSGVNSNITFDFSKIISLLIPGHTQMTVQFSDFPYDETKMYNDKTFVLDIIKEEPKPGILKFTPIGSSILSYEPSEPDSNSIANMTWQVINVDYVTLNWVGYCGEAIILNSKESSNKNPCEPDKPFSKININMEQFQLDLKQYFPHNVLLTLDAFKSNGSKVDNEQITFQFKKVITLSNFSINVLAALGGGNEVEVQASPYQLITKENIILADGTLKGSSSSQQSGSSLIDQYKLMDLIPGDTISSASTFEKWKVEFNNSPEHSYDFSNVGKITTQFPVSKFNAAAVALYTSIGLLNNQGSNLQLDFNSDQKTLNLHYTDIHTSNTYRTVNNVTYKISKDGFGLSFADDNFVMASNGKGDYKGLSFDLSISVNVESSTSIHYMLNGKATAKNSNGSTEVTVSFTASANEEAERVGLIKM